MSASVLSFIRRRHTAPTNRDWAEQEKAEFFRVIDVLGRSGLVLELETGLTDEGEPWAAFCAVETGDPVVHIARLDGRYVLAAAIMPVPIEGPNLRDLVRRAVDTVPAAVVPKPANKQAGGNPYLHPAALLLILVATAWFQALHAAELAPGGIHPESGKGHDAPADDPLAASPIHPDRVGAACSGDGQNSIAAAVTTDLSNQSFQQIMAAAVVLLSVADAAVDLLGTGPATGVTPDAIGVIAVLPARAAVHAPDPVSGELAAAADPGPDGSAPPAATLLPTGATAADDTTSPVQNLLHVATAAGSTNGLADMPPPAWIADHRSSDHGVIGLSDNGQLQSADDGARTGNLNAANGGLPHDVSTWWASQSDLGTVTNDLSSLSLQAHVASASAPSLSSDAEVAWSLITANPTVLSFDTLPANLEQKIAAVIPSFDSHLIRAERASMIPAAASDPGADGQSSQHAVASATPEAATPGAATPEPATPGAATPEAATTTASSGTTQTEHSQPSVTAAPVQAAVAPATVALVSDEGSHGAQTQQVSLNDALIQLQSFVSSAPDYLTVQMANSLVLIEQAVLANPQLPHVFESFDMPDGSEIAWVQLVGVAHTPVHV